MNGTFLEGYRAALPPVFRLYAIHHLRVCCCVCLVAGLSQLCFRTVAGAADHPKDLLTVRPRNVILSNCDSRVASSDISFIPPIPAKVNQSLAH